MEFFAPYHLWIALAIFVIVYAIIATEILHKTAIALFGGSLVLLLGVLTQGEALHLANFEQVDVVQLEYFAGNDIDGIRSIGDYKHVYLEVAKKKDISTNLLLDPANGDAKAGPSESNEWQVKFHKASPLERPWFEVNTAAGIKIRRTDDLLAVAGKSSGVALTAEQASKIDDFYMLEGEGKKVYVPTMATYILEIPTGNSVRYAKFSVNRVMSIANFREYKKLKDTVEVGTTAYGVSIPKAKEGETPEPETKIIEPNFVEVVDWNVILLLAGMMIIVGVMKGSGIFQYIAVKSAHLGKGSPIAILLIMATVTAVLSAFLDNVTTVVLTVPVTITVARTLKINPVPMLIAQIIASNIGGTATLIGDPPNIMIGSATANTEHPLGFVEFIVELTPGVVVILISTLICFYFIWRKAFSVSEEDKRKVLAMNAADQIVDRGILWKSSLVLGIVILGFFFHGLLHLHPATIALFGAGLLFVITRPKMEHIFTEVEWPTLFFFIGLFIIVGGLQRVGMIAWIADNLREFSDNKLSIAAYLILWGSAFASAIIDNIPFVATMIPIVKQMGSEIASISGADPKIVLDALWWSLSLGACLGGNGTAIGASANVVTIGIAEKEGYHISFAHYLKFGVPLMILSIIIAHIYIWLFYIRPAMM